MNSGHTVGTPAIVTASRTIDVQALAQLADIVQTRLAISIAPGVPLGVWVDDAANFAAGIRAALAVGAEAFIISPEATSARALELCAMEGASAVLCDAVRAAQLAGGPQRACGPGLELVEVGQPPSVKHDDPGSVHFFTSGTDGRPKIVVRSAQSLELEASTVGSHLGMAPGRAVLCAAPVTHAYGFAVGLFAPLASGATAVVARPRLAASLAKVLAAERPDIVVAVPAQYSAWSTLRRAYAGPLPRLWVSSGAPLPPTVRTRFQDAWGCVIAEQYGMTECGAVSIDLEGSGTLGRPYPGVTLAIDGGGGSDSVGEVVVNTPFGARGYLGAPSDSTGCRFTSAGFRTADSGWLDTNGRLHLVGRRAHQLNVRGQQVDPAEIERAFWDVDGVRDVAVIGVDREDGDQWIAALVVCVDTITNETLQMATSALESFKRPQRVVRLQALPRTATGKLDRAALSALTG